jgi:hypothetical protein
MKQIWNFSTVNSFNINFHAVGGELFYLDRQTDRQTDIMKLTATFLRMFFKVPRNVFCQISSLSYENTNCNRFDCFCCYILPVLTGGRWDNIVDDKWVFWTLLHFMFTWALISWLNKNLGFTSSGTWCCVTVWEARNVYGDSSAFVFKGQEVTLHCGALTAKELQFLKTSEPLCPLVATSRPRRRES